MTAPEKAVPQILTPETSKVDVLLRPLFLMRWVWTGGGKIFRRHEPRQPAEGWKSVLKEAELAFAVFSDDVIPEIEWSIR